MIKDWPAWWEGIQQIANPVRRDFYIWLAFSGCRAGETMEMEVKNLDLEEGIAKYPITKTVAFELPLSDFMVELLRNRIAENVAEFGEKCRWVFPSATVGVRSPRRRETDRHRAEVVQAALVATYAAAFMDHDRRSKSKNQRQPPANADQPQTEARQE